MEGKTARGASSPANPALHIPDPLSTTSAAISSSMAELRRGKENDNKYAHPATQSRFQLLSRDTLGSLPVNSKWGQFKKAATRWRSSLTFRPSRTKGGGAAFCYYHIRTWFGFEQLCGYRRRGARPELRVQNEKETLDIIGPGTARPLPPLQQPSSHCCSTMPLSWPFGILCLCAAS